jgi:hypothetical protein
MFYISLTNKTKFQFHMIRKFLFLFFVCSLILISDSSVASHGMGGEITYECQGNGMFIFRVKFYRDCNGINAPTAITISTTHVIGSIVANLTAQNDLSPKGFLSNGITSCPTCSAGSTGNPISGLVEEYIYESSPVQLSGVPPLSGWRFWWGECCRSALVTNLVNPGSNGFGIRTTMYPYNGQNMYPCYDSSPQFYEKPSVISCTGLEVDYNHLTYDTEMDSLHYEFSSPFDIDGITTFPFASGYSITSPLPGPLQDPANIPASLNPATGAMNFQSFTGGYFAVVVKVSSFKCGVKVAEVFREINLVLTPNCPTILNGQPNTSPNLPPPFQDPVTGMFTSYTDTVFAGDTVNFEITSLDFNQFLNATPQQLSLEAYGLQYGANFTDVQNGCLIPPCATLNPPTPFSSPSFIQSMFNWTTTTAHLGYSFSCVQFNNTYYYIMAAHDNYCPANAKRSEVFSITVMPNIPKPPVINNSGVLSCTLSGTYVYQWFLNRLAIPGATSSTYTPVLPGVYQVLAVAPNGDGNYSDGYSYNPVGLASNELINQVSIMPNPSKDGIFTIAGELLKDSNFDITITDIPGKKIFSKKFHESKGNFSTAINLSGTPKWHLHSQNRKR